MKIIKKTMTILIVFILSLMILSNSVNAASTTIRASASKVTVGKSVSVTVNFGEKLAAAQFILNFDESKFDYISCSVADGYSKDSKYFAWISTTDTASLSSVTFTFKAKAIGSGTFNISNLVASDTSNKISGSSVTVTVQKASTSSGNNTQKPTQKPTQTATPNPEENTEEFSKIELENLELELVDLIETDYTEESWKALQEAMEKARNAKTNAEYDEVKNLLTIDTLEIKKFDKPELNQLLRDLMGKAKDSYTEESWNALQEAIELADKAELESEYEAIKDKLSIDTLVEYEEGFFENIINFFKGLDEQERISLALGVCVLILFIVILIVFRLYRKEKKRNRTDARRLK